MTPSHIQETRSLDTSLTSDPAEHPYEVEPPLEEPRPSCSLSNDPEASARALIGALWADPDLHHQISAMDQHRQHFRNLPATSVEDAVRQALALSAEGRETYFAVAEYGTPVGRTAANVHSLRAVHMDIDCGAVKAAQGKGYKTTTLAKEAVAEFCERTKLPPPTIVVNSGSGLHLYWVFKTSVLIEKWLALARKLKELTQAAGLLADPSRTADAASVLRIPGTRNHKTNPPRPVELESVGPPIDVDTLSEALTAAHSRLCPKLETIGTSKGGDVPGQTEAIVRLEPPDLDRLRSALRPLDPDCDEQTWKLYRIAPLAREARLYPVYADQFYQAAKDFSSGKLAGTPSKAWSTKGATSGLTGEEAFEKEWQRFLKADYNGNAATLGTIYHDAKQAGWQADLVQSPLDEYARHIEVANAAVGSAKSDVGAPLEPACVEALAYIKARNPAEYTRIRRRFKDANKDVRIVDIDAAVARGGDEKEVVATHHGYATDVVQAITVDIYKPVSHEGMVYVVDPERKIWVIKTQENLQRLVAERHDGKDNCKRRSDYLGIALHAAALVSNQSYFADAPVGIACPDGFLSVCAGGYRKEPLTPAHRQRVLLDIVPSDQASPRFTAFLNQTFKSDREGEAEQQIALVQEIAGAVMLGLMPRYQKAVLFYDPYGRAGKGTLESILRRLVPPEFVTAVSPVGWDKEYYVAALAGSRLNVVGELPETDPLPAANFKSVLGGDPITGRNPTQKPFTFKNGAAHIFMSNHMITTRDQSEAFFARWQLVEFPNSLLQSGLPLDPTLADDISRDEMPGIAHWALQGAARLLQQGKFSSSMAHDRLMAKWRRGSSSLHEFIDDGCKLEPAENARRSHFYQRYERWCGQNGRKALAKGRVKEMLENNIGLGVKLALLDGNEVFRGIKFKDVSEDYDL